jgi:hypothetical protein
MDWDVDQPPEEPVIDWNTARQERKRRGWVHFQGGSLPQVGGYEWIVMSQDHTDDPNWILYPTGKPMTPGFREGCGHLLDFETARCAGCGQPFEIPPLWGSMQPGLGVVVQFLEQGEALYHDETCAPEGWNRRPDPKPVPNAVQGAFW